MLNYHDERLSQPLFIAGRIVMHACLKLAHTHTSAGRVGCGSLTVYHSRGYEFRRILTHRKKLASIKATSVTSFKSDRTNKRKTTEVLFVEK